MKNIRLKKIYCALILLFFLSLITIANENKPQTSCPIMGGKINKNLFVDANEKRIYVCCQGCLAAVRNDPQKALKQLTKKGEKAEKITKTRPLTEANK